MSGQKLMKTEENGEKVALTDEHFKTIDEEKKSVDKNLSLKEDAEPTDVENTKKFSTRGGLSSKEEIKESATDSPTDMRFASIITEESLNEEIKELQEIDDEMVLKNKIEIISKEIESFMLEKENEELRRGSRKKNSQYVGEIKQEVTESVEKKSENASISNKSYVPPPEHASRLSETFERQLLSPRKISSIKNLSNDNDKTKPTSQDAASQVETPPQGSENISQKDLEMKEEKQTSETKVQKSEECETTNDAGSETKQEKTEECETTNDAGSETKQEKTEECETKNDAEEEPKLPSQKLLAKAEEEFPTEAENTTPLQKYSRTRIDIESQAEDTSLHEGKTSTPHTEFLKKSTFKKESSLILPQTQIDKDERLSEDSAEKKLRFGGAAKDSARHPTSKGMKFQFKRPPKTCEKFLSVEEYSKILIDEVTEQALCYIETNISYILYCYLFLQRKEEILGKNHQLKSLKESHMQMRLKTLSLLPALARMFAYSNGPQSSNSTLELELPKSWNTYLFGNFQKVGNIASTFYMEKVMEHAIYIAMKQSLVFPVNSIQYRRLQPVCTLRSHFPELDLGIALWMCIIALKLNV